MKLRVFEGRALSLVIVLAVLVGAVGAVAGAALLSGETGEIANLDRFAALTFGDRGAPGALAAALTARAETEEEEEEEGGTEVELPELPDTPLTFSDYRTPNGWALRPAGRQVDTDRAPTGIGVSPDGKTVIAVSSGTAKEFMTVVDATTFARTEFPTSDMYMGAAINEDGYAWVSTGSRNRVMLFRLVGPVAAGLRPTTAFPGSPNIAIPVIGYPGNMVMTSDEKLLVAGNLSVPGNKVPGVPETPPGGNCASSTICSVINVLDVSDPLNSTVVDYIEVGRDAFDLALNEATGKLYVSNWADETNPARAGGTGTVSIVDLAATPPAEVKVMPVGRHPTGIALSPDGSKLFVANSADDTLSKIELDAAGLPTATETFDLRLKEEAPKGATPLAVEFTRDGSHLLVGMAGQNAIEVRQPNGGPMPRSVEIGEGPLARTIQIPHTYIPAGWWPSAMTAADHPTDPAKTRLYVTNLKGIGAGPGLNAYFPPGNGARTQGTLQAIDLPTDAEALEVLLGEWTATVVENNNWGPIFDAQLQDAAADPCTPAPLAGGGTSFSQFLCDESKASGPSPYHVMFIVKENKTFDQFFGDVRALGIPDADADPTFLLYGEPVTTNQHNLARLFAVGDDFWADSEQSTTGHSWTSAGYATDYLEITWNPEYSEGLRGNRGGGQYANQEPSSFGRGGGASDPAIAAQERELFEPEERLVDLMADPATNPRGATFRIYSTDVDDDSPAVVHQFPPGLFGLRRPNPHNGGDLEFPDTDRAELFIDGRAVSNAWNLQNGGPPPSFGREIKLCGAPDGPADDAEGWGCDRPGATNDEYQKFALSAWVDQYEACMAGRPEGADDADCQAASMPNFIYLVLPVDHTLGFNPLAPTPASMVADNDHATGLIVEALSKSPFWKNTLILATEDDTQLAGDHVDSHRTFLLAAGGLARRHGPDGAASHQPGSFPSILKTVEVMLGLPTLTIYDKAAVPLHDFVVETLADRNDVVYEAVRPPTPFLRNPAEGELATLSSYIDWRLDRADSGLLSAMFYYGEKGWPLPAHYRRLIERGPARR